MTDKANICGKRIKIARVSKDMAQIDLSAALNIDFNIDITQNGISDLERGERSVKDFEVIALAKVLDVNPLWILFGNDLPEEYR
ncbi:MAG: helix-turn-helix domain-containing protein [Alphaproteobacteria bacterium]